MSTYSQMTAAVIADLQGSVPALAAARTYQFEPFFYDAGDPAIACWWESETFGEGPTGSRLVFEVYVLRYWEAAPFEDVTLASSDAEVEALQTLYEAVRDRFLASANLTVAGAMLRLPTQGSSMAAALGEDAFVRGFEIRFAADRFRTIA